MTDAKNTNVTAVFYALLSAILFGLSVPFSKVLVGEVEPIALAGLLYLGAFGGLAVYSILISLGSQRTQNPAPLDRNDLPWLAGSVVVGGMLGPISLMFGLTAASGFTASLFLNLEGLTTALIAGLVFKEYVGKRVGLALICMTAAGFLLTWDFSLGAFSFTGPLLLLLASLCWGLDNNFTRKISGKDPVRISQIKGLVAGLSSLFIAFALGRGVTLNAPIAPSLLVGALSYGASLVLFIMALRGLGASRTGAFFSVGPFVGAVTSLVLLGGWSNWVIVLLTFALMATGVWLIASERSKQRH